VEAPEILVIHIIYQMDTHMVEMQEIIWQEIMMNGQQLNLKSIK
jgi:hypothetical protein